LNNAGNSLHVNFEQMTEAQFAGLTFESDPVDQPWLWRQAHLRDPAGNLLCLYSGEQTE